jgi:hypothetical protein
MNIEKNFENNNIESLAAFSEDENMFLNHTHITAGLGS